MVQQLFNTVYTQQANCKQGCIRVWTIQSEPPFFSQCQEASALGIVSTRNSEKKTNPFTFRVLFNDELNSLHRYDTAQNYWFLHRVVQRLSQNNLRISHRRRI
jgi:hypothetical protein